MSLVDSMGSPQTVMKKPFYSAKAPALAKDLQTSEAGGGRDQGDG